MNNNKNCIHVLTCVLGEPDSLNLTFNSIKPFLSDDFRWIVKFAGRVSEDFVKSFLSPFVHICFDHDTSIYEAMNQGLGFAEDGFYFVIGAGDELLADGVQILKEAVEANQNEQAFFMPVYIESAKKIMFPNPDELNIRMSCPHPGVVLRVKKSKDLDGFDPSYKIAADYDHLSRYVKINGTGCMLSVPLAKFASGGMSERRALEGALEEELIRIRIWNSHDLLVQSRLLVRISSLASSIFDYIANIR